MIGNYTFFAPQQIVFGWGRRREVGALASTLGRRVWLLSGSRTLERQGHVAALAEELRAKGLEVHTASAPAREPEVADVDALTNDWRARGAAAGDCVVAIGGGSTLDLAKAAAAMVTNRRGDSVLDYLEGVGKGWTISEPPLPLLAMPTTAGTGSEATKNAVISSYDPPFKKSLRSDRMVPRIVLVDPELSVTVPRETTAYTGMDALTQLLESALTRRAAPIPQALCRQGLQLAWSALPRAVRNGGDREAREAMAHAALLSGMALANSGLGVAHGVAAALGVHHRVPHGLACAVMLPAALRINRFVREAELAEIAHLLLGRSWSSPAAAVDALLEAVDALCRDIGIPSRLRDLGVPREDLPRLVPSSHGNSLSGNPRELSDDELRTLLESLW
uniref:Iron-containing alcohol dehydrogenase n=1 Tax=Schlesneria paludicola TaxID=360056 RepID=A0A7C4QMF8_9PLAN